ncbi:hypothetical protein AEGHOMDF_5550 [Methylobacterium soli]|nr:hypothetical protein AEGHOMDF_5550 [Methylobacterium soli]
MLLARAGLPGGAGRGGGGAIVGLGARPDRRQRGLVGPLRRSPHGQQRRVVAAEGLAAIDHHHDRGFQALRPVDRHDPDLVTAGFEIALDRVSRLPPPGRAGVAGEEAAERGRVAALLRLGGSGQEHVDGIARLAAETGHEAGPALLGPEQRGVEAEGAVRAGEPDPALERREAAQRRRIAGARVAVERVLQCLREFAPGGDPHEVVVGEADQRRLEGRGERQVVGRQETGAAQGHEIVDGDMRRDIEPVLACHRHAEALEGADDLLEGGAALAHQDQDLARPAAMAARVAAGDPGFHRAGDAARRADRGGVGLGRVDGGRPGVGLDLVGGLLDRPELHRAGRRAAGGGMHRAGRGIVEGEAVVMRRHREGGVHRPQHAVARPERQGQADIGEG